MPLTAPAYCILAALAEAPRHGYAIMRDVASSSAGSIDLKATTLYATLDRLSREGLVTTAGEEIVDGRARRYFRLTDRGVGALEEEVARLEALARAGRARLRQRPAIA